MSKLYGGGGVLRDVVFVFWVGSMVKGGRIILSFILIWFNPCKYIQCR